MVLVVLAVGAMHLRAAAPADGPVWTDDEIGPLATARLLAGVGAPFDLGGQSYYPGWAVVLTPLWWISQDPATVYRLAVGLSAVVATLTMLPLAALARRTGAGRSVSWVVAGVVAVAPSQVVFSSYALIENALMFMLAVTTVAACRFAERASTARAVLLGVLAAATFVTHGRMVVVPLVTAAWFALELARRRRPGDAVALGALVVTAVAGFALHVWASGQLYASGTIREEASFRRVLEFHPGPALKALIGQVWYANVAWIGLTVVGVGLVAVVVRRELRRREPSIAVWAALVGLAVLVIGVLFVGPSIREGAPRSDVYTYGRYLEPVAALFAVVGLALLVRGGRRVWLLAATSTVVTVVTSLLVLGWTTAGSDPEAWWAPINVPGLLGIVEVLDLHSIPRVQASVVAATSTAVLALIAALFHRRLQVLGATLTLVLSGGWLLTSGWFAVDMVHDFNVRSSWRYAVTGTVQEYVDGPFSIDVLTTIDPTRNLLQLAFAGTGVETFHSGFEEPTTRWVVADLSWSPREGTAEPVAEMVLGEVLWRVDPEE